MAAANLRSFESVVLTPGTGISWIVGPNGAGKTTLLEAAYILSHGRSFRSGGRNAPIRHGAADYVIRADVANEAGLRSRLGLQRSDEGWMARRDGESLQSLAPLFEMCPVVYFGPESQTLMTGSSEERRAFLDWSVFHVEHDSLEWWRAWRRSLRQRNALLRRGAPAAEFLPWERNLDVAASRIHAARSRCLRALEPYVTAEAGSLAPELGAVRMVYHAGWDTETGLAQQLAATRDRDRERGFTHAGVHRADWTLAFEAVPRREYLSRGQAKAAALACTLALTDWLRDVIGEYPLLCLDDIESELDPFHAERVFAWLANRPIQSWITRTNAAMPGTPAAPQCVFHVEHGHCVRVGSA